MRLFTFIAVTLVVLGLSPSRETAGLEDCEPKITAVSEPVLLGKPLTVSGVCFGHEEGQVLLGEQPQTITMWSDKLVELIVDVTDPEDAITLITATKEYATSKLEVTRHNLPTDAQPIREGYVNIRVNNADALPTLAVEAEAIAVDLEIPSNVPLAPDPNATPTPAPGQSTITIRFVGDAAGAEPIQVGLYSPITRLLADGIDCTPEHEEVGVASSGYVIFWPRTEPGLPDECTKGPPTALRFEFTANINSGHEDRTPAPAPVPTIIIERVWQGGDLEIVWPILAEADLSASPTSVPQGSESSPSSTPSALPTAGGPPDTSVAPEATVAVAGFLLLFTAAMSFLLSRRGR